MKTLTVLCGVAALLLFLLPGPRFADSLTPLTAVPAPSAPATLRTAAVEAVPPGAVVLASVTLAGGADTVAWLDNGGARTSRRRVVESLPPSSRERAPEPRTWSSTFLVPSGPGPLALVVAWKAVEPEMGSVALWRVDSRYYARHALFLAARAAALVLTAVGGLLLLRRRLGAGRFGAVAGGTLLPLALAALVAAGLLLRWDGSRGPHGQVRGFSGLVDMGSGFLAQAIPAAREVDFRVTSFLGYDGDQYVQIALDPLLRDPAALAHALDAPAYRAKRVLAPALAHIAGFGKPYWIVQAYALLNAAFWLLLLLVLRRAFPVPALEEGAAMAFLLLSFGVLESLRRALVDLPACALLACAVLAAERGASARPPLLLAAAALTRESLLVSFPLLLRRPGSRFRALVAGGVGIVLIGGWYAYVASRFPGAAQTGTAHNFAFPGVGLFGRFAAIPHNGGWLDAANRATLLGLGGLLVQAAFLVRFPRPGSPAWRAGILYVPLLLCLGQAVVEEYYAAVRVMLPLTLAFHWELARTKRGAAFWLWAIPANLALLDGLGKYLFSSR